MGDADYDLSHPLRDAGDLEQHKTSQTSLEASVCAFPRVPYSKQLDAHLAPHLHLKCSLVAVLMLHTTAMKGQGEACYSVDSLSISNN